MRMSHESKTFPGTGRELIRAGAITCLDEHS